MVSICLKSMSEPILRSPAIEVGGAVGARAHRMEANAMSERLSAWMDGELDGKQVGHLLAELKRDTDIRVRWACYHLAGDALRGVHERDFSARILDRLHSESTVLAPHTRLSIATPRSFASAAVGLAALAFVGTLSWMNLRGPERASPDTADVPPAEVRQVALKISNDSRDYLLAHQQYSPGNSMQGLGGYVRAMSQEFSPARRPRGQGRCDCQ